MTLDFSELEWNENTLGLSDKLFALDQRYSIYNNVSSFKPKETRVQMSDRENKHRKVLEGKENWENLSSFLQAVSVSED